MYPRHSRCWWKGSRVGPVLKHWVGNPKQRRALKRTMFPTLTVAILWRKLQGGCRWYFKAPEMITSMPLHVRASRVHLCNVFVRQEVKTQVVPSLGGREARHGKILQSSKKMHAMRWEILENLRTINVGPNTHATQIPRYRHTQCLRPKLLDSNVVRNAVVPIRTDAITGAYRLPHRVLLVVHRHLHFLCAWASQAAEDVPNWVYPWRVQELVKIKNTHGEYRYITVKCVQRPIPCISRLGTLSDLAIAWCTWWLSADHGSPQVGKL